VATLFFSRYLVPVTSAPIEDGGLLVSKGRIVRIGRRKELTAAFSGAAVVDFGDAILLPPLVNAHTHLELTHFPLWARQAGRQESPASFVDWILQVIRVKRSVDPELFRPSLTAGIEASLAAGTGAVGDILSYFPARQAYAITPLRGNLYLEILGRDPALGRQAIARIGELLNEKRAGQLKLGVAPHSPYSVSEEFLQHIWDFARRRQVPTSLHLAESPEETTFMHDSAGPIKDRLYPSVGWQSLVPQPSGHSPVALVERCGGLVPSCLLVHGVQVDAADAQRLAKAGSTLVCCPRSNARLGVGKAPVERYRATGVPLALGTDSLASCDSLSVWDEIAFAHDWFEGRLLPAELLAMATINGARALGVAADQGELKAGLGCNFQVLTPAALPEFSELETFLCSPGRSSEVTSLFLDSWDVLQNT
jgi:cytosine/adenosine deaminase-related metal-dependent hydrolase